MASQGVSLWADTPALNEALRTFITVVHLVHPLNSSIQSTVPDIYDHTYRVVYLPYVHSGGPDTVVPINP